MKSGNIFEQSLVRLTLFFAIVGAVITFVFTIPPFIAQWKAEQRYAEQNELRRFFSVVPPELEEVIQNRSRDYSGQFTELILVINGTLLVALVAASYFIARTSLEPLKEVLDKQETFAAEVAHELRTPMANVLMEIDAFKRAHKNIPPEYEALLSSVSHEVGTVGKLSQDVLSLMAVEYISDKNLTEKFSLPDVARQSLQTVRRLAEQKHISLSTDKLEDATLLGSKIQIRQLITILLDNAIKYTPEQGTVKLSVTRQGADKAEIIVSDTGAGIAPQDQPKIFDKFFQANNQTDGSGLGLSIAKRICEQHHASIDVESTPGKGSTFRVVLPIQTVS